VSKTALIFAVVLAVVGTPASNAQPSRIPRIGILSGASEQTTPAFDAFRDGLRELGYVEGQNVVLEFRLARGQLDLFPALATELVRANVDVIVTDGGNTAPLAAKQASQTIPIVMAVSGDPVTGGVIASFSRPGGNVTGLTLLAPELSAKRLQLFKDAVPQARRVAVLRNGSNRSSAEYLQTTESAARSVGVTIHAFDVRGLGDLDSVARRIARERLHGLITLPDVVFWNVRAQMVEFAHKTRLPAMFPEREFVDAGGLMAYGPSVPANFRRAATFVDKILKGARPADLPVEQPVKFELVVNLRTARALDLTIPSALLQRADQLVQ
jgi:putative ABC transport system substrate-binding protein